MTIVVPFFYLLNLLLLGNIKIREYSLNMQNLMENLNKEQLEAVTHKNGPLLIVAGAGTGKTTVITQKIAYTIEQDWAKPEEILALTFTEKAAGEMEERVDRLLPLGYLDLWISTFHSFGERILKEHGLDIGLPADFKLLNEFEQYALIKNNLDKFDLDYYRPLGNPTKFIQALTKHFSRLKDEDIEADEYLKYAEELRENMDNMLSGGKGKNKKITTTANVKITGSSRRRSLRSAPPSSSRADKQDDSAFTEEIASQEIERINEVANAYHIYNQLLLENNALDFGDLINYTLRLFRKRPVILEKYRQQFKYILLDEFQDTNWAQYELIKLLASPKNNLTVVGDDDQSIYKFRGASVSNILQFKKDFSGSKQVFLVKNYRNRQNILDLSYEFIKQNDPNRLEYQLKKYNNNVEMHGYVSQQISKKLKAQKKGKGVIEIIEGSDLQDEVKWVVEKIADLKIKSKRATTNGAHANKKNEVSPPSSVESRDYGEASWNDFAILVRANESAKDFCNALDMAGLPYQFLSSRGLYVKPVIMDVISYLKLLDDYHESPAVYRILNLPVFDFFYQELINLNYLARKKAWSLFSVIEDKRGKFGRQLQGKIDKVLRLIEKHTVLARNKSAIEVILAFLEDSGYLKYLTLQDEQKSRETISLLNYFIKRVKKFETGSDDKSVKAFLVELQMEIDAGEQGDLPFDVDSGPEAIKIMTVHGAKGLEFRYVFIANLVDKRFPTIERREAIEIPDALVKEILPEGDIHLEEERRLFYVAMTRAREQVYFSWAPDYGGVRQKKPSRFLEELNLIEKGAKGADKKEKLPRLSRLCEQDEQEIQNSHRRSGIPPRLDKSQINSKFQILKTDEKDLVPAPSYFSHTQLTAFKNCPYQYRFAHILKIPTRGKFVFSFGQAMHLTLQKLFELVREKKGLGQSDLFKSEVKTEGEARVSLEEALKLCEQSWIDDWYDNAADKEKFKKKGREIIKEFYNKHRDNWPDVLSLEQGINFKLKGYRIYGKIDRIDNLGQEGIQIVDYKTGQPKAKDKIGIDDKEQLLIYQLAVKQVIDKKIINLQYYYLDNNSEVNFLGSQKELKEMEKKIIERIKGIEEACQTGNFPHKSGPLCKYCDFKEICEFRKLS